MDGSGLKMACTTLKGRNAALFTQGVHNSWKFQLFGFLFLQLPGGGSTVSGEDSPWRSVRTDLCFLCLGSFVVAFWGFLIGKKLEHHSWDSLLPSEPKYLEAPYGFGHWDELAVRGQWG